MVAIATSPLTTLDLRLCRLAVKPGDRGLKGSDTAHLPGFPRTPHHAREPHNMRDDHTQDARQPRDLRVSGTTP